MSSPILTVIAILGIASAGPAKAQDAWFDDTPFAIAQSSASAICICALPNGTYSAWFHSRPSNWGTPNPIRVSASSCIDTGLCGSISQTQSYVTGSFTITPSNFQSIGNLHGVYGDLTR